ncbi:PTS sugar transporter subunit IIA [bacterium]|nr:PTS sugar transporter subunit IIA [bacterium]
MLLSELLQENTIILDIDITQRFEIIDFLINQLGNIYCLDKDLISKIRNKIIAREKSMSTGLGRGLAVPHAEVTGAKSTMAVMGVTRKGIDFNSLDGIAVRIVVLLVMPAGEFKEHIMTLSGIAHLMKNQLLRQQIVSLKTAERIFSCILTEEINELLK